MEKDKGWVLVYDRCTAPIGMSMKDISDKIKETGECVWDSSLGTSAPTLINLGGDKNSHLKDVKIIDVKK